MRLVPPAELEGRVARVQQRMATTGLDALLVLQTADLFWLAGTTQQGALWLPAHGDPLFLVRKDLDRAREESALRRIEPLRSPRDLAPRLAEAGLPPAARVGMELDVVPVALYRRWEAVLGGAEITDASPLLKAARSVKSPWELDRMRAAARVSERVFARAAEAIRPGMTELELAADLELEARRQGHQGVVRMRAFNAEMFFGHVFAGADSAVPSGFDAPLGGRGLSAAVGQGAGLRPIQAGEPVLVDFVTVVDGYGVDQTRTFCLGGLPTALARACHDVVGIQDLVAGLARPGVAWGALWDACDQRARSLEHDAGFMGAPGAQVSFVGHGIGIEVDEPPYLARGFQDPVLEAGMTFALEPKFVFPGVGAVGVEDTFLVTADGLERLTLGERGLVVL